MIDCKLLNPNPGLRASNKTTSIKRSAYNQIIGFCIYAHITFINFTCFGIKNSSTGQLTVFFNQVIYDHHSGNGFIFIHSIAFWTQLLRIFKQLFYFSIILSVGSFKNKYYRLSTSILVIDSFPLSDNYIYLSKTRKAKRQHYRKSKKIFFHWFEFYVYKK